MKANSLEKTLMLVRLRAGGEWVTEDEMLGWHHQLNGHGSEQTQGDSEGQGSPGVLQSMGLQRVT